MEAVACNKISERAKSGEVYILVVSKDCHFCHDVVTNVEKYGFSRPIIVVTYEDCRSDIDDLVSTEAFPTLVHLDKGKEIRRAVGVEEIESFETQAETVSDNRSGQSPE